jgi:hypothetical protein
MMAPLLNPMAMGRSGDAVTGEDSLDEVRQDRRGCFCPMSHGCCSVATPQFSRPIYVCGSWRLGPR